MVQRMAMAIGGTLVAPTVLFESCSFDPDTSTAGPERLAVLDAIAETIIPRTKTAGARDAQIGAFIDVMIRDCYYPDMQEKLNAGIQEIAVEGKRNWAQRLKRRRNVIVKPSYRRMMRRLQRTEVTSLERSRN